jgi:predicted phosphodiesterase
MKLFDKIIPLVGVACLLHAGVQQACAIDLQGELSGFLPAGTYTIVDDISVAAGATLTLAPGVVFQFEDGLLEEYEFEVFGTLTAIGTQNQQIIFQTAPEIDEYNYIRLASGSSHLKYCLIEGAGSIPAQNKGGLWIDNCSPLIESCIICNGTWHGMLLSGSDACPSIDNCQIVDNDNDGINCRDAAGLHATNCIITGNGVDGICLSNGENLLIGCLVAGNEEDGVDCKGISDYEATLLNCTVGPHPGDGLCDSDQFTLVNCVVVDDYGEILDGTNTYIFEDLAFMGFANPGNLDFHLVEGSPCLNSGTRFGIASILLPDTDPDGNPRQNGIVDIGAFESTEPPSTGEEGTYFSKALLLPRMTQPVIRATGETFTILIARLGVFGAGDVQVQLENPLNETFSLPVVEVSFSDRSPGSDVEIEFFGPGIERVQEITVSVPPSLPADFYDITVNLSGCQYSSINAVKILNEYPDEWMFINMTDPHIGHEEEAYTTAERLHIFVNEANCLNPQFTILSGDVCEELNIGVAFPDTVLEALSLLRAPVLVMSGNHDYYNDWLFTNPYGYFRYFQEINRVINCEFRFGNSVFYCIDSGPDLGPTQLWRCRGPLDEVLDWMEEKLQNSDSRENQPLFFVTHGPTYDAYMWSVLNTARVKDIMNNYNFSLGLAGHTHQHETYLNEGENYIGRNDFVHADDWVRDIPFPGYPLHIQTSSVCKGEMIDNPDQSDSETIDFRNRARAAFVEDLQKGESDPVGWRCIKVVNGEVSFFTADTDGDGYRNTEYGWFLGNLVFSVDTLPGDVIRSEIVNQHYETWFDIRHFIMVEQGIDYEVTGGTFVRQYPGGIIEVTVDFLSEMSSSIVLLTPIPTGIEEDAYGPMSFNPSPACPNPFSTAVSIGFNLTDNGSPVTLTVFDLCGRHVKTLVRSFQESGYHNISWDGRNSRGDFVPAGVYCYRLEFRGIGYTGRMIFIR